MLPHCGTYYVGYGGNYKIAPDFPVNISFLKFCYHFGTVGLLKHVLHACLITVQTGGVA